MEGLKRPCGPRSRDACGNRRCDAAGGAARAGVNVTLSLPPAGGWCRGGCLRTESAGLFKVLSDVANKINRTPEGVC